MKEKEEEVVRISDKIIVVKLMVDDRNTEFSQSICTPQMGYEENQKEEFWCEIDEVIQRILGKYNMIGRNINEYVGRNKTGSDRILGRYRFNVRNKPKERALEFVSAYGLVIVNTYLKKRKKHCIINKSRKKKS